MLHPPTWQLFILQNTDSLCLYKVDSGLPQGVLSLSQQSFSEKSTLNIFLSLYISFNIVLICLTKFINWYCLKNYPKLLQNEQIKHNRCSHGSAKSYICLTIGHTFMYHGYHENKECVSFIIKPTVPSTMPDTF